ncbi:hypothetical protein B0H14DRAFT_3864808 [Mycena olivaceomarginata]|nr:hypothetical protein B0H14DRAFT_3864808 [Mycena olivaceomarginata]
MRAQTLPWIFRDVYNWSRPGIWPETLWGFFMSVHIRDYSASVPAELLRALSLAPCLIFLEIHQARFDGSASSSPLPFATLESLVVCISGFRGVISGDLLSPDFLSLTWVQLWTFVITEHTPTPYITVPELVSKTPALHDLSILFSADLSRDCDAGEM